MLQLRGSHHAEPYNVIFLCTGYSTPSVRARARADDPADDMRPAMMA